MAASKRRRVEERSRPESAKPEELQIGTRVTYGPGEYGVVHQAFVPIDEFWIAELESGELIRDEEGNVHPFKAAELSLMPPPQAVAMEEMSPQGPGSPPRAVETSQPGPPSRTVKPKPKNSSMTQASTAARVLVIADENQMRQILVHFGPVSITERREPQLPFAVPVDKCCCGPDCQRYDPLSCQMCNPESCPLLRTVADGMDEHPELVDLASRLRPDIEVQMRAFHMKQALEQIGPDLPRLAGYFCLSTITLPYGEEDIEEVEGEEREYRENICCQIDLGVSAVGAREPGDASLEETARRALREYCCIDIAPDLWAPEGQLRLRNDLEVDLPLKFWDCNAKVFVIILPIDAASSTREDLLCFDVPAGGAPRSSKGQAAKPKQEPASASQPTGSQDGPGGRSIDEWQRGQDEFAHLGKLPKPWIFVRSSRDKEVVYYLNTQTKKTTAERPLPPGWTKQTSKSTGKTYYYHQMLHKSVFEIPQE